MKPLPSIVVKKNIEQIKKKKRGSIPADEELKQKANQILYCVYAVANGEQDKNIYETDFTKR